MLHHTTKGTNMIKSYFMVSIAFMFCLCVSTESVLSQCLSGNCYDGQGYFLLKNGDRYIGQSVNGKSNGIGAYLYKEGYLYFGQWKNGKRHGKGYFYSNSSMQFYIGTFNQGKLKRGTLIYSNGDIYDGEYINNYRSSGSYYSKDSGIYIGEWKDNKRHGQGKYINPDGKKVVGTFSQDRFLEGEEVPVEENSNLRFSKKIKAKQTGFYYGQVSAEDDYDGYGVLAERPNKGMIFSMGYFQNDNLNGPGVQVIGGDVIALGEFINGNLVEGLYVEKKGDQRIYIGRIDTTSSKFAGTGCLVFQGKNESYYGQFSQGEYHGRGSYFWPSGEKYNGTFDNGNKVQGIETFPDGEIRRVRYNSYGLAEVLEQIAPPYSERRSTSGLYGQNFPKTCDLCKGVGTLWFPDYNKVVEGPNNCYTMIMPGDANWMRGYDYYVDKDCDRNFYTVTVGHYETCLTCGGDGIK